MAEKSPIKSVLSEVDREVTQLSERLGREYEKALAAGKTPEEAIEIAFRKSGFEAELTAITMRGVTVSVIPAGYNIVNETGFRKFYLSKHWRGQDLTLSQTIHNITRESQAEITRQIRVRLRAGRAWNDIATNIRRVGVTKGELPAYLKRVEKAARKALKGDHQAFLEYRRYLRQAEKQIARLSETTSASVRLKKAYSNFIARTSDLDAKTFANATRRATEAVAHYRSSRVAQTEVSRAYGLSMGEKIQNDEDAVGVRWVLSSAHKIFDICDLNQGIYPVDQVPTYPAHPHCLLPGSEVHALGRVSRFYDAVYEGPCVEIILSGGKRLTLTINHPVLTNLGFVPAGALDEGSNVLCCADPQRVSSAIYPDYHGVPSAIENVPKTFSVPGEMAAVRVPSSAEYLHGDGVFIDGEINVVNTEAFLGGGFDAELREELSHHALDERSTGFRSLFGRGISGLHDRRLMGPSDSSVGFLVDAPPFSGVSPVLPDDSTGFALASVVDASQPDASGYDIAGDTELLSQFLFGLPGNVSFQHVVDVRYFNYSGHVHDLQCDPLQIYICNGAVVHNCRCVLDPVYRRTADTKRVASVTGKLDKYSESQRKQLLGIKGAEAYKRRKGSWKKNLRNRPQYRPLLGADRIPQKFLEKRE